MGRCCWCWAVDPSLLIFNTRTPCVCNLFENRHREVVLSWAAFWYSYTYYISTLNVDEEVVSFFFHFGFIRSKHIKKSNTQCWPLCFGSTALSSTASIQNPKHNVCIVHTKASKIIHFFPFWKFFDTKYVEKKEQNRIHSFTASRRSFIIISGLKKFEACRKNSKQVDDNFSI